MPGRARGSPRSRRRCGGGGPRARGGGRPGGGGAAPRAGGGGGGAGGAGAGGAAGPAGPGAGGFAAVAAEVGRLLAVDMTVVGRYGPDGLVTAVGVWSGSGGAVPVPAGWRPRGPSVASLVFETGRPARVDDFSSGPGVAAARSMGARAAVGVPITVAGALWGVMTVVSTRADPPPAGTEARLAGFVELVATA